MPRAHHPAIRACLTGALLEVLTATAGLQAAPEADRPDLAAAAAHAIEAALATDLPPGARLIGANLRGSRLELDFSAGLADLGPGSADFERVSRGLHRAAAAVLAPELASFEIHTAIAGVPLHELLAGEPTALRQRPLRDSPDANAPPTAALGFRRVAVSPGHGYYLNGNAWTLQRGYWQGIVEDFVNHDMVTVLRDELQAAGAEVLSTRNLDRAAGTGEGGFARWQEAARYHVKALGAPASVWNEPGYDHLSQDIRCRPL